MLDRYGRLIGVVNLRALILADQAQTIEDHANEVLSVRVDTDQEQVANLFARYDLLAIPVVDMDNRLVGIVTIDDVVDVLEEEATEDIYRRAQISEDAEIFSPLTRALRNRLPWLYVNSVTALLAAAVVAMYEDTIAALALLAVFMPVVAGMGGNAGNQTMTIVVRSLALGEISVKDVWHVLLMAAPWLAEGFLSRADYVCRRVVVERQPHIRPRLWPSYADQHGGRHICRRSRAYRPKTDRR